MKADIERARRASVRLAVQSEIEEVLVDDGHSRVEAQVIAIQIAYIENADRVRRLIAALQKLL